MDQAHLRSRSGAAVRSGAFRLVIVAGALALVFSASSGCLLLADPPTSIKLLEPAPVVRVEGLEPGATVHGVVDLEVTVESKLDVETVLSIGGDEVLSSEEKVVAFQWDTTGEARGAIHVVASATDEVGRTSESDLEVTVDQLPGVHIDGLEDDDIVGGRLQVAIDASDDGVVERITWEVDGSASGSDSNAPWVASLDTCEVDGDAFTLSVTATDDIDQTATDTRQLTVEQDLVVQIQRSAATTLPDDALTALVVWDQGFSELRFELDGAVVHTFTTASGASCSTGCPGRCRVPTKTWNTRTLAEGGYTLTAVLVDASGRTATDSVSVRVDHDVDNDGYDSIGYGGTDCDDALSSTHPGATDACNGRDDDCDGGVDEDFDADGDGYAGAASCPVSARVDCDDTNASVNPGASEICGDGIDNDCDGPDTACRLTGSHDAGTLAASWYDGETSYDNIGTLTLYAGDVDGDGYGDLLVGSWLMDSTRTDSGESGGVYLITDAGASSYTLSNATARIEGVATDGAFGYKAVALGDVNGDSYDDFAVSEPTNGNGYVYLFRGPLSGSLSPSSAASTYSQSTSPALGFGLCAADLDGDGDMDLVAGRGSTFTANNVLVYWGPLTSSRSTAHVALTDSAGSMAGYDLATVQDVDGDGWDDLLIGAPLGDDLATDAGGAYLVTDMPTSSTTLQSVDEAFIRGVGAGSEAGARVSSAGDVDGDGYGDVLIGAPWYSTDAGRAYLWTGPISGTKTITTARTTFLGTSGDVLGYDLASGDFDGDGFSDVAVTLPLDDTGGTDSGTVALLYGPVASGTITLPGGADLRIPGDASADVLGEGVAFIPDLDGDGADELLLGAGGVGSTGAGRAYLIFGASAF